MHRAGRQRIICLRDCLLIRLFALFYGLMMAAGPTAAQNEIATFKLVDVDAGLSVGYTLDDREVGDESTRSNFWVEQLSVKTRSYVYHPALLDMIIGGALVTMQDGYESNQGASSGNQAFFNYDAEFRFLARKRYPFSLHFRRDHPDVTNGILGRFIAANDEYGAQGTLYNVLLPITVYWDAVHSEQSGSGFGSTVDETTDRFSIRTSLPYNDGDVARLSMSWDERQSASGSAGLPIEASVTETINMLLSGRNTFGEQRKVSVDQRLMMQRQDTQKAILTEVDKLTYSANMQWYHSDAATSYASFGYTDQERTETSLNGKEFGVGTQHRFGNGLQLSGRGAFTTSEDPAFARDRVRAEGTARYSMPFWIGNLSFAGSLNMSRTDQEAASDTSEVFDEPHILTSVIPVSLNQDFVLEESVVVVNLGQTQTFVEDLDYRLVTIGSTTTIERIPTGNIFDGEEVLVSYEYQTGGTTEYGTIGQSVSANFGLSNNINIYASLGKVDNEIRGGLPTTPLNDTTTFEFGGRVVYPITAGWSVSGDFRHTRQDEDISPFVRNSFSMALQTGSYWGTSASVGFSNEQVDYEFSDEDVDGLRYFAAVSCNLPGASRLTYRFTSGKNEGGSLLREDRRHVLQFDWRYRRVSFSLRGYKTAVAQGLNIRDDLRVEGRLVRIF